MNKSNELDYLLGKMNGINGDQELNHINADKILVDTILLLASNTIDKDVVNKIVKSYTNIDKWYS